MMKEHSLVFHTQKPGFIIDFNDIAFIRIYSETEYQFLDKELWWMANLKDAHYEEQL